MGNTEGLVCPLGGVKEAIKLATTVASQDKQLGTLSKTLEHHLELHDRYNQLILGAILVDVIARLIGLIKF